jgi:hypothetical protein
VAAAWTACTNHLRWGRRAFQAQKPKQKASSFGWGPFVLHKNAFPPVRAASCCSAASKNLPRPSAQALHHFHQMAIPPKLFDPSPQALDHSPLRTGAILATIRLKATTPARKTQTTHNPRTSAHPAAATWGGGSACADGCDRAGSQPALRKQSWTDISGTAWLHLMDQKIGQSIADNRLTKRQLHIM